MAERPGPTDKAEPREEYDFSGGEIGKHADAMRRGYTVTVHKQDGSTEVRDCARPDPQELPEKQRAELDRRLDDYRRNPDEGTPWENIRDRLRTS